MRKLTKAHALVRKNEKLLKAYALVWKNIELAIFWKPKLAGAK